MTTTDSHKEKPMIRTEIATITPELAKQLLGGNTKNRRIKQGTVDSYARDMKAGNWRVTGEAIVVNGDGTLLNGQHRLLACIKSGAAFETLLVTGIESAAQETMDQGVKRSFADVLSMRGEVSTAQLGITLSATAKYRLGTGQAVSIPELLTLLEAEPHARDIVRTMTSKNLHSSPLKWRTSVGGVLGMEVYRTGAGDFDQFCRVLAKPDAVGSQHPIYLLRERLIGWSTSLNAKPSSQMMLAVTFKAWNAWVMGERPKMLKWSAATERFPALLNEDGETVSEFGFMAPGQARGERVAGSKLTERDVQEIRDLYSGGGWTHERLAAEYLVTPSAIGQITRGEKWAHVA